MDPLKQPLINSTTATKDTEKEEERSLLAHVDNDYEETPAPLNTETPLAAELRNTTRARRPASLSSVVSENSKRGSKRAVVQQSADTVDNPQASAPQESGIEDEEDSLFLEEIQAEAFQKEFCDKWFPKLLEQSYFIPPVHINPEAVDQTELAGQTVLIPLSSQSYLPLQHAVDDHMAQKRVMDAFRVLAAQSKSRAQRQQQTAEQTQDKAKPKPKKDKKSYKRRKKRSEQEQETELSAEEGGQAEVMVVLSQVKCSDFHSESLCTAPDFRSSATPAEGDFDVLVINLKRGILIGCIKLASNRATDIQLAQLEEAITYLNLTEQDVRQLCERVLVQLAVREIPRAEIKSLAEDAVSRLNTPRGLNLCDASVLRGDAKERIVELSDEVFSPQLQDWASFLSEESAIRLDIVKDIVKDTRFSVRERGEGSFSPWQLVRKSLQSLRVSSIQHLVSWSPKEDFETRSSWHTLSAQDLEYLAGEVRRHVFEEARSLFLQRAERASKYLGRQMENIEVREDIANLWKPKINECFREDCVDLLSEIAKDLKKAGNQRLVTCQLFGDSTSKMLHEHMEDVEKLFSDTVRSLLSESLTEQLFGEGNSLSRELLRQAYGRAANVAIKKLSHEVLNRLDMKASDSPHLSSSSLRGISQQVVWALTEQVIKVITRSAAHSLDASSSQTLSEMGARLKERVIDRLAGVVSNQLAAKIVGSLFNGVVDERSDVVKAEAQQLSDYIEKPRPEITEKLTPDVAAGDILKLYMSFVHEEVRFVSDPFYGNFCGLGGIFLLNYNSREWLRGEVTSITKDGQRKPSEGEIARLSLGFLSRLSPQEIQKVVDTLNERWNLRFRHGSTSADVKQLHSKLFSACAERLGRRLFAKMCCSMDGSIKEKRRINDVQPVETSAAVGGGEEMQKNSAHPAWAEGQRMHSSDDLRAASREGLPVVEETRQRQQGTSRTGFLYQNQSDMPFTQSSVGQKSPTLSDRPEEPEHVRHQPEDFVARSDAIPGPPLNASQLLPATGIPPCMRLQEKIRRLFDNQKAVLEHVKRYVREVLKNASVYFIPDLTHRMNTYLSSLITEQLTECDQSLSELAETVFGCLSNPSLAEDLAQGIVQMVKDHKVLDKFQVLCIRKTVILPHVTTDILKKQLERKPDLRRRLGACLEAKDARDPAEVTKLCLCGDMLPPSDYQLQGAAHRASADVRDYVCRLLEWWNIRMEENGAQPAESGTQHAMSEELYRGIVSRFCTPATSVQYYSSAPPRIQLWKQPHNNIQMSGHSQPLKQMWSLGQAVNVVGAMFTRLALYPSQVDVLLRHRERDLVFLTGPPGTGKTVMLMLKAAQWLKEGQHVHVLRIKHDSLAATHQVVSQLRQMAGPGNETRVHLLDCLGLNRKFSDHVLLHTLTVLRRAADEHEGCLNIITDEANCDVLKTLCERLTAETSTLKKLRFWASGVERHREEHEEPGSTEENVLTEEKLTDPLRCPPTIVSEVARAPDFQDGRIYGYSMRPEAAPPTPGLDPITVQHSGLRHKEKHPWNCITCGEEVGRRIRHIVDSDDNSLSAHPLTYRDVFVIVSSSCKKIHCGDSWSSSDVAEDIIRDKKNDALPFAIGLRKCGVPVHAFEGSVEKVAALAHNTGPDAVTLTRWYEVWGLERKVVVWVGGLGDTLREGRLYAMSRTTARLIRVE